MKRSNASTTPSKSSNAVRSDYPLAGNWHPLLNEIVIEYPFETAAFSNLSCIVGADSASIEPPGGENDVRVVEVGCSCPVQMVGLPCLSCCNSPLSFGQLKLMLL